MKKRISIAVMLAALFAGGCPLDEVLGRLAKFPDHVQVFTVDNGDWLNVVVRFPVNPLANSLAVR